MSDTALDRVMNQAETAAGAFQPNTGGSSLVPTPTSQAPATRPSLDSMADSAGINVDLFLTVKYEGFRLGEQKGLFDEAKVRIDLTQVAPILSIRATRGGNTQFIKSYDGVMTSQGQNFQVAEQNLRATHDKVDGPYQTAEIPATLLEDVSDRGIAKGFSPTTIEKGTRIGITPPMTGVKFWTEFYNELRKQGLQRGTVDCVIRHKPQTNRNGNEWGVVVFELIGEAPSE